MISKKSTFFLGIFIFIIPFLGLPSGYKNTFVIVSGIVLIILSVTISIPKKPLKNRVKKEKANAVFVENIPIYPRDNTIESASVRQKVTKDISSE